MIAERYPELAQLPDEDKLTLMVELWQDVMDDSPAENPALAAFVEQLNEAHRRREEIRSG
jgi:quinol monooxygenase YgiN